MNATHTLEVISAPRDNAAGDDVDLMIYEFDGAGAADLGMIAFSGHTRGMDMIAFSAHTGAALQPADEAALV